MGNAQALDALSSRESLWYPRRLKNIFLLWRQQLLMYSSSLLNRKKIQKKTEKPSAAISLPILFCCVKSYVVHSCSFCVPCGETVTLRYNKKAAYPRKRSQHCSYIQANQLVRSGKNTKTVTWTLYWYKKNWRSYLRKVKIYSCWSIFPHYPDVQDT